MEDVAIKDQGFRKAIDRIMALKSASVIVGPSTKKIRKYGIILEHLFGWRTRIDRRIAREIQPRLDKVQAEVIAGEKSFNQILGELGGWMVEEYRNELLGKFGLEGGVLYKSWLFETRKPGLRDTGALIASIRALVKVPTGAS
jgi:hypothetical protein